MEQLVAVLAVLSILVLVFFGMLLAFMFTALYVYLQRRNLSEHQRRKDYHQLMARRMPRNMRG